MDAKTIVGTSKAFINIIAKHYLENQIKKGEQNNLTKKEMLEDSVKEFFKNLIIDGAPVKVSIIENKRNDNNYPTDLFPISFIEIKYSSFSFKDCVFDDFNKYGDKWRYQANQYKWIKNCEQVGNFKNLSDKNDQIIEAFRKYMADHLDEIKPGLGAEYRKMLFNNLIAETKITAEQIGRTTYGMETKFNRIKNILDNKTKIQANIVDATQQLLKK